MNSQKKNSALLSSGSSTSSLTSLTKSSRTGTSTLKKAYSQGKGDANRETTTSITDAEIDEIDRNQALGRYYKVKQTESELQVREAKLKSKFEHAKKLQTKVNSMQDEIKCRQDELGKMYVLRETLKFAKDIKHFADMVITPAVSKNRIPLRINEEEFDRLKSMIDSILVIISF